MRRVAALLLTLTAVTFALTLVIERPAAGPSPAEATPPAPPPRPRRPGPPPEPSNADRVAFAAGLDRFAGNLHARLAAETLGNLAWSPYSLACGLGMLRTVAEPSALPGIDRVAGWEGVGSRVHGVFARQMFEWGHRDAAPPDGEPVRLRIANGLWRNPHAGWAAALPQGLFDDYRAEARELNASNDEDNRRAVREINGWVERATERRIDRLIDDARYDLILVNALVFTLPWSTAFDAAETSERPFRFADGTTRGVMTMHGRPRGVGCHRHDGMTVVTLPCEDDRWRVVVAMPDRWAPDAPAGTPADALRAIAAEGREPARPVGSLWLPQFALMTRAGGVLEKLVAAGMDPPDDRLQCVEHAATLKFDENGIEGSAATAMLMLVSDRSLPGEPIDARIDRPFYVFVQNVGRDPPVLLMCAQVTDPRSPGRPLHLGIPHISRRHFGRGQPNRSGCRSGGLA